MRSSRPMVSKLLMEMTQQGVLARDGRRRILVTAPKSGLLPQMPIFRGAPAAAPAPRINERPARRTAAA